jgi:uncharacterized protein
MSHNFVKDPREVVKSGDVVTVKVLEVDVARQRIGLTLRLDDEVGVPKQERSKAPARPSGQQQPQPPKKQQRPQRQQPAPRGSMAEALRKAGFGR